MQFSNSISARMQFMQNFLWTSFISNKFFNEIYPCHKSLCIYISDLDKKLSWRWHFQLFWRFSWIGSIYLSSRFDGLSQFPKYMFKWFLKNSWLVTDLWWCISTLLINLLWTIKFILIEIVHKYISNKIFWLSIRLIMKSILKYVTLIKLYKNDFINITSV